MTATYESIATSTTTTQQQIDFTGISSAYTDLRLVCSFPGVSSNNFSVRVGNGSIDTGTNYSWTRIYGTGSAAVSNRDSNQQLGIISNITIGSSGSQAIVDFLNYSNTTTNKTALTRFDDGGAIVFGIVGLWRSTSAINQIRIYSTNNVNFASGTTFTLYGIKAE
jgi:hypothetical protein